MTYAKNLPRWERVLRLIAGAVAVAYGWLDAPATPVLVIAVAVGTTMVVTSLFGFCPACAMVGRKQVEQ